MFLLECQKAKNRIKELKEQHLKTLGKELEMKHVNEVKFLTGFLILLEITIGGV